MQTERDGRVQRGKSSWVEELYRKEVEWGSKLGDGKAELLLREGKVEEGARKGCRRVAEGEGGKEKSKYSTLLGRKKMVGHKISKAQNTTQS